MKRKLLVLLCAVMATVGVKAYTGSAPTAGNTYYLYHPAHDQFLFVGLDDKYGVTPSVFNATPIYVETGGSGNSRTTFSFVIRGTKYYMYQNGGDGSLNTGSGSEFEPKPNEDNKYRLQTERYKPTIGAVTYRMLHAGTSGGQCSFENYKSSDNDGYEWQFIPESEVESARSAMAESCASTAANYAATSNGWERVTSVSDLHSSPENYFFAIFSANTTGLMLQATSNNAESQKLYYKTAIDPASSSEYLFEMENHESGGFALKSSAIGKYFANIGGAWDFHADQTSATSSNNTNLTLTYANGAYTIETAQTTNYVGLWTLTTNWYSTDKHLAGNKQSSLAGSFLIYRIPKQRLRNVNFTQCITNPSFETGNTDGWTVGASSDTGVRSVTQDDGKYAMSNSEGSYLFNTWWQGIPMTQNIGILPAGHYSLSAVTTTDQNAKTYLTVNSGHNDGAISTRGASVGVTNTYNFTLAEATEVSIGVVGCGNDEKAFDSNGYYWYKVDNFRLTYLGGMENLTAVSGKMNAAVNTAQQDAVSTYNSNKTVANYLDAIEAIAAAEASIAAYANAATYLSRVETLLATTNFYTPDAYDDVYGNYKTAYDAGTLDDATADALSYKVANYTGTERYDNNTANDLLIPGWTIGGNDARISESGFYINTWSTEEAAVFSNPFYEYWTWEGNSLEEQSISATMTDLDANRAYSLDVWVRVRERDNNTKVAGRVTLQMSNGDVVDLTAADQIGTTKFYQKQFTAYGKADGSGNLTVTFTVTAESNISWLAFKNLNLTALAGATEYSALNAAITAANANTLGFGEGEYAPYNNIAALTALAAAKSIDTETANTQTAVLTVTSNLTGASWSANVSDVDAVYNGDFAIGQGSPAANIQDYGWTRTNGWGQFCGDSDNSSTSKGTSYYNQPGSLQYGNAGYYTMPLKANTVYQLSFKYASWATNSNNSVTASVLNSSDGMAAVVYGKNGTAHTEADAFVTKTIKFVTGEAGDYVLTLANSGNTVITDVSITKASQILTLPSAIQYAAGTYPAVILDRSFSAEKWNTLCVPFAFDASDFSGVKELSAIAVNGDNVSMTFADASTIAAGQPYLVKSDLASVTFNDVALDPSTAVSNTMKEDGTTSVTFVGTFSGTNLTSSNSDAWVVSNNNLYNVNSDVTVGAYRAYFTVGSTAGVKALTFDFNGTTGIEAVDSLQMTDDSKEIYNLAGQKLDNSQFTIHHSQLKSGVYIVNGKKVLVK